jgi:pyridoxamine 5'-phosphate oxidase
MGDRLAATVISPADLDPDPLRQFQCWYDEAVRAGVFEAGAMALATAAADGRPSVRMVLFKGLLDGGFVFFTNYLGRKAREILENPRAALVFYWAAQARQVRVEGRVERTSAEVSSAYFRTRPRESQLGAWASPQGEVLEERGELERRLGEVRAAFDGQEVPCPPFWGGFRLVPEQIEFWSGREGRLHDRFLYLREEGGWRRVLLAP